MLGRCGTHGRLPYHRPGPAVGTAGPPAPWHNPQRHAWDRPYQPCSSCPAPSPRRATATAPGRPASAPCNRTRAVAAVSSGRQERRRFDGRRGGRRGRGRPVADYRWGAGVERVTRRGQLDGAGLAPCRPTRGRRWGGAGQGGEVVVAVEGPGRAPPRTAPWCCLRPPPPPPGSPAREAAIAVGGAAWTWTRVRARARVRPKARARAGGPGLWLGGRIATSSGGPPLPVAWALVPRSVSEAAAAAAASRALGLVGGACGAGGTAWRPPPPSPPRPSPPPARPA